MAADPEDRRRIRLVPRFEGQGYGREQVDARRRWVEEETGSRLPHLGAFSFAAEAMQGNVENPIGAAQVPIGVAGPLTVDGEHARGTFYVPLATTEGAMVRSYERGMVALTRAGGARVRITADENRICPVFRFDGVGEAHRFASDVPGWTEEIRAVAGATTRHGELRTIHARLVGRSVLVELRYATADASGMNMIARASDAACRWLADRGGARSWLLFSGAESEKRPAGSLLAGGKGKWVVAGAQVPRRVVRAVLGTTAEDLAELWHATVIGHLQAATLGYNGQIANGLAALYIACGQDVANLANSAVGTTTLEALPEGDLYASVTLPSLTVGTVGGGTALGTGRECLEMIGCFGAGKAPKLAEIVAATLLAGELSFGAAVASGGLVAAHESYGRNRPGPEPPTEPPA